MVLSESSGLRRGQGFGVFIATNYAISLLLKYGRAGFQASKRSGGSAQRAPSRSGHALSAWRCPRRTLADTDGSRCCKLRAQGRWLTSNSHWENLARESPVCPGALKTTVQISKEVLLYSTWNYIQSLVIEHDRGQYEKKNVYICNRTL